MAGRRYDAEAAMTRSADRQGQLQLGPIDIPTLRHMAASAGLHGLEAQLSEFF